jgi:hypothetical protein
MRQLVDFDHGSRRLVDELDGEQQVLSRRVEDGDIALEASVDGSELLDRSRDRSDERGIATGLRNPFETDVALLAEPVERLGPQRDPVLGRCSREPELRIASRHRTDPK